VVTAQSPVAGKRLQALAAIIDATPDHLAGQNGEVAEMVALTACPDPSGAVLGRES
jgi:hypothetical protein